MSTSSRKVSPIEMLSMLHVTYHFSVSVSIHLGDVSKYQSLYWTFTLEEGSYKDNSSNFWSNEVRLLAAFGVIDQDLFFSNFSGDDPLSGKAWASPSLLRASPCKIPETAS